MTATLRVAALDELGDGEATVVELDGRRIALVRVGEQVYALGDTCSHVEVSLSEGDVDLDECALECPKHGSAFDLRTGEPLSLPALRPVPTYAVQIRDGEVFLEMS